MGELDQAVLKDWAAKHILRVIPVPNTGAVEVINGVAYGRRCDVLVTFDDGPYGRSQVMPRRVFDEAYGLRSVSLRYFNAAGAAGELGEDHHPETHLIPLVLAVALGHAPRVSIYGTDYPTPDGTAVEEKMRRPTPAARMASSR